MKPKRAPGPVGGRTARVSSTVLPALAKRQLTTGFTTPALLLFRYMTTCQRCAGTALSDVLSMVTRGTVGPAVIGTVPRDVTSGFCTTTPWTTVAWASGSKARSAGVFGPLLPPTFSGVQTCPVLGSTNSDCPADPLKLKLLAGAWPKACDAIARPVRQARMQRLEAWSYRFVMEIPLSNEM